MRAKDIMNKYSISDEELLQIRRCTMAPQWFAIAST